MARGLIIAGTHSGCGKTSVSLGLMALFRRRGLRVAPFKVGPDYIDPGHHRRAAGRVSRNLDGWMLSRDYNKALFERVSSDADIAVVEGVMGLYDGFDGRTEAGSTAQMAKWLGLPVVLVVDARSMARSGAALVKGFEGFDPDLRFAGVVFNRVGSPAHLTMLTEALDGHVAMPCLGGIDRNQAVVMPERHLGLVTDEEQGLSDGHLSVLADMVEAGLAVDDLLHSLNEIPASLKGPALSGAKAEVRIGVARDRAFCFYYPDNLELLEEKGAELVFFSPLSDTRLPENLDGLYFGGGYPELFAKTLSANHDLRRAVRTASTAGMPIYGECGGFMYLCREIRDFDGNAHPMTGCFPFSAVMLEKLRSLGYREVTLTEKTVIGPPGQVIRGHEFHYSHVDTGKAPETVYQVSSRRGGQGVREGYRTGRTLGSYVHLHWGSRPDAAAHFVSACREYRRERMPS
ncbi:cobyrinate a,c-diamide synthase [Desulfatiferula olefinivorans]